MPNDYLTAAAGLSDRELLSRLGALARHERDASAELVAHLAELDSRQLYLAEGFGSLFRYCTEALGLSEDAAYTRIEVARAARVFPPIIDLLVGGSVSLTAMRLLAPHLTAENHQQVMAAATGRSKRDVEMLVARLAPRPDIAGTVRKLPVHAQSASEPRPFPGTRGEAAPLLRHRPVVAPLAPERYKVQFAIGEATREKLRLAQDLLRRQLPDGDLGALFDRALTALLEQVARDTLGAAKPGPQRASAPRSRHVPAALKRAVWLRDGGQCAFVSTNGRRTCVPGVPSHRPVRARW